MLFFERLLSCQLLREDLPSSAAAGMGVSRLGSKSRPAVANWRARSDPSWDAVQARGAANNKLVSRLKAAAGSALRFFGTPSGALSPSRDKLGCKAGLITGGSQLAPYGRQPSPTRADVGARSSDAACPAFLASGF